jgi:hypothetical protein
LPDLCLCSHLSFPLNERIPLLQKCKQPKTTTSIIENPSLIYIQKAITLLLKIGSRDCAKRLQEKINTAKNKHQRKKIVKNYIHIFEKRVTFIKRNYVIKDQNGNILEYVSHKLDPIITLLKIYIRNPK